MHEVVRAQRENDVVLDLEVFRIRQIVQMEKVFDTRHTLCRQVDELVLFIDDEITVLFLLHTHDGIHLGKLALAAAAHHLLREDVAGFIQLGRFVALTGDDERGPRFVDQDRVHFVDDRVVETALHELLFVDRHVVAQIIEPELVVRDVGDVAVISRASLVGRHGIQNDTDREPQKPVDASHPLRVTLREIVVDRDDMHALAFERVQIRRQRRDQRLAFTGAHLGNTSLVQHHAADQLHAEVFHSVFFRIIKRGVMLSVHRILFRGNHLAVFRFLIIQLEYAPARLTHQRVGLRQDVIQRPAFRKLPLEFVGLCAHLHIRQLHHPVAVRFDLADDPFNTFELTLGVRADNLFNQAHEFLPCGCFFTDT